MSVALYCTYVCIYNIISYILMHTVVVCVLYSNILIVCTYVDYLVDCSHVRMCICCSGHPQMWSSHCHGDIPSGLSVCIHCWQASWQSCALRTNEYTATEIGDLFGMYCIVVSAIGIYAAFAVALCAACSYLCSHLCSLLLSCATWHIQCVCTVCSSVSHIGRWGVQSCNGP